MSSKHILAVFCHPARGSYTGALLDAAVEPLKKAGHTVDVLDLHAEAFNPAYTQQDFDHFYFKGEPEDVVRAHQKRVDAADALVIVSPIWWWSFPAMLKGWIDRVFTGGWAYSFDETRSLGLLKDRPCLLLLAGASKQRTFTKYGYDKAMSNAIDIGIFGYCGIKDVVMELLLDDDTAEERTKHLARVAELANGLFDPAREPRQAVSSDRKHME